MRNEKRELNDIKFEFLPDRDSAEGIAGELVGAGLVHAKDQNAGLGQGKIIKDNASRWRVLFRPTTRIHVVGNLASGPEWWMSHNAL